MKRAENKPITLDNELVEKLAREIGFDLVGFAAVEKLDDEATTLENWIARGYHGGMSYMSDAENIAKRKDVRLILPNAETVISLGVNYYHGEKHENKPGYGKVSRYAWGKDYHRLIWNMLEKFEARLREFDPQIETKSYTDTGPVMDAIWAYRAGLGWIGKNTTVINPEYGSWFFIANVITNRKFTPSVPLAERCGTCTACIDACPTNALLAPRELDATKCISYLTIENKGEIPDEFYGKFEGWIFGCDICQDVCPWNKKFAKQTTKPEFAPINKELDLDMFEEMSNREFNKRFAESPIKRARVKGMHRNARFLKKGNSSGN